MRKKVTKPRRLTGRRRAIIRAQEMMLEAIDREIEAASALQSIARPSGTSVDGSMVRVIEVALGVHVEELERLRGLIGSII